MSDVAYFYPPVYQQSPAGSTDDLGPVPGSGGAGTPGAAGQDGASTLTGTGAPPDSLGKDGDSYFALNADGDAVTFYSPKANGHWPSVGVSLIGPAAPPAPTISGGNGPPDSANVGLPGSLYLDRASSTVDLYQAQA
jgi:hypothetical protein